ncbi:MAG TPA: hypothetical protein VKA43_00535 [Gammaproteobacteria bacterium]|nr:hypothetical protein [Gammaproteobacteria bacterium]
MSTLAEIDALFKLPLGEFTSARNELAAQLKKAGKRDDAAEVKALLKPSASAWVVNQIYWRHRGLFNRLIEAGDRMRRAQAARGTGDSVRDPAGARRDAVTALTKIAEGLLLGAEHGATRGTLRRVTSTLEALSSYGSLADAPPAGRLTDDVEPPGFDAIAAFLPGSKKRPASEPRAVVRSQRPAQARAEERSAAARRAEEERQRALTAAKAAVREAERTAGLARKQVERAAARLEVATARVKEAEGKRAEIEKRLARASKDVAAARADASDASTKATEAMTTAEAAERAVALARGRLQ